MIENELDKKTSRLHQNPGLLLFLFITILLCAAFFVFYYYYLVDSDRYFRYLELCTQASSKLLSLFGVSHSVGLGMQDHNITLSTAFGAEVVVSEGSDASLFFLLLASAILAWPGKWIKKTLALIAGLAGLWLINILRISGMLIVDIYAPLQFDAINSIAFPGVMVIAAGLYFYAWTIFSGRHPAVSRD